MLRILIRCLLVTFGLIFLGLSGLVLLSGKQINKNRLELADMQDRVTAVEKFELKNYRAPTKEELHGLFTGLPVRHIANDEYDLASTPRDCPFEVPGGWPDTPGWVIYFWRGEWYEYYSSWNKHYTLTEQASWWGFCGPMLFCPLAAAIFIGTSFLPAVRRKRPAVKNAPHPVVQLPTSD